MHTKFALITGVIILQVPTCLSGASQFALDHLPPGGVVKVPVGNYYLSSTLSIKGAVGLSLVCDPGTTIANRGGTVLSISDSTDLTITGCTLVSGGGRQAVTIGGSKQVHFSHNNIIGLVSLGSSSFVTIAESTLNSGVFVSNNVSQLKISNNVVYGSLVAHTDRVGSTMRQLEFANNLIYGNGHSFCIEIGAFSGSTATPLSEHPADITLTGNNCVIVGEGMYGGYSLAQVMRYSVSGNTYYRPPTIKSVGVAGLELASADSGAATGNTLNGDGLSIQGTSDSTISSNTIRASGISMGSSVAGVNIAHNRIIGNITDQGLRFQCNAPKIDCSGNIIAENYFRNDTAKPHGVGIQIENDVPGSALMLENVVIHNHLSGFATCFVDSGTSTRFLDNFTAGGCTQPPGAFANDPTATVTTTWQQTK